MFHGNTTATQPFSDNTEACVTGGHAAGNPEERVGDRRPRQMANMLEPRAKPKALNS